MLSQATLAQVVRKVMAEAQAMPHRAGYRAGDRVQLRTTSVIHTAGEEYRYPVTISAEVWEGPGRKVKGKVQVGQYLRGTGTLGTAPFAFERMHVSVLDKLRAGGRAPLYAIPEGRARHVHLGELEGCTT